MNLIPVLYFYTPENHSAFMDEVEFLGDSQLYSKLKEITERNNSASFLYRGKKSASFLYRGKEDVDFILKEVMEKLFEDAEWDPCYGHVIIPDTREVHLSMGADEWSYSLDVQNYVLYKKDPNANLGSLYFQAIGDYGLELFTNFNINELSNGWQAHWFLTEALREYKEQGKDTFGYDVCELPMGEKRYSILTNEDGTEKVLFESNMSWQYPCHY